MPHEVVLSRRKFGKKPAHLKISLTAGKMNPISIKHYKKMRIGQHHTSLDIQLTLNLWAVLWCIKHYVIF